MQGESGTGEMDKSIIKSEIEYQRELANDYFADWQKTNLNSLVHKVERHIDIADALELALCYQNQDDAINKYKTMLYRLGCKVSVALMCPQEEERKRILHEVVREVQDVSREEEEVL